MTNDVSLTFVGGAGTVTGSKYWIQANGEQILLDCGLFQGLKQLRLRNWENPPFEPQLIDAVVLSHGHLDHSGYLPVLVQKGFRGPIYCTPGTADVIDIVLRDAAHIQEEEAERANRYGYSKHHPARPLYTKEDVEQALRLIKTKAYGEPFTPTKSMEVLFRRAGHILGSATVELNLNNEKNCKLVFSGDLGRWNRPILREPELVSEADILLVESTYGDRLHSQNAEEQFAQSIAQTIARKGVIVIPAFAVGRTQELIWTLRKLEDEGRLPVVPVYIDSPMAINVTDIYCQHPEDHNLDMKTLMDKKLCPLCCREYNLVYTAQESKELNTRQGPMIIIAGSGMATGGRVLHHLKQRLPDEKTMVLLPGFQAAGTRGRSLQEGARTIRIHGQDIPVRAQVETLDGFSAHADQNELLRWLRGFKKPPRHTYIVHGESNASNTFAEVIQKELGFHVSVAKDGATIPLHSR
jgi:metallo-beta-lactamase family protein